MCENERFQMTESQRKFNESNYERFLDDKWANMSIPNKAYTLYGDTAEAEARFRESSYYEEIE